MKTTSFWEAISKRSSSYPKLTEHVEVDFAIIGGGITGMTTALQLMNAGKKVAIIEAHKIGGVTTGNSTGNLYIPVQPFYQKIATKFNIETAKAIAHSRKFAIDFIEKIVQEKNIPCQFSRRPWYGYTADHARISLDSEVELFDKMEIPLNYITDLPLKFKFKKAVTLKNQARFNPLQYVISLAEDLAKKGCLIFEDSCVINIEEKDFCKLKSAHGSVKAEKVLMATHTPVGINLTQMFTAPYRSYVVAVHLKDKAYPEGHFWDLDRPPHATSTHAVSNDDPEILMVAGSHHKVGQEKDTLKHYHELESFLNEHFSVGEIAYQWSAQHYQTADNVPYIGLSSRTSKRVYMATGYFADGLVYGTLAGIMMSDVMLGKNNPLVDTYQANRFDPLASANFLVKENTNVLIQYLKDLPLLTPAGFNDIKKGEGRIVEVNREKCAVSRDENGQLHVVSAVCTHMKCIVNWNSSEKTWDCPCHGSRFTLTGNVIEGPANMDLKKMDIKEG